MTFTIPGRRSRSRRASTGPRRRRSVFAASTASALALGAAMVVVPTSNAEALTCKQNQTFRISSKVREYRYAEVYNGGGKPRRTGEVNYYWDGGRTDLVMTTCRDGKAWKLMSPIKETPVLNGLARNGDEIIMASGRVRGFGSPAMRVLPTGATVNTFVCYKGELFTGLKQLLGLPLPVKTPLAVGLWLGGLLLPEDSMHCNTISSLVVPMSMSSGRLSLKATTSSGPIYRSSTPLGDIKLVNEWWVTLTATRISG